MKKLLLLPILLICFTVSAQKREKAMAELQKLMDKAEGQIYSYYPYGTYKVIKQGLSDEAITMTAEDQKYMEEKINKTSKIPWDKLTDVYVETFKNNADIVELRLEFTEDFTFESYDIDETSDDDPSEGNLASIFILASDQDKAWKYAWKLKK
ncbi:MAG: hypothetical protein V4581_03270 [Bacteroidota bacterium]